MISKDKAKELAEDWIALWNSHDIESNLIFNDQNTDIFSLKSCIFE